MIVRGQVGQAPGQRLFQAGEIVGDDLDLRGYGPQRRPATPARAGAVDHLFSQVRAGNRPPDRRRQGQGVGVDAG